MGKLYISTIDLMTAQSFLSMFPLIKIARTLSTTIGITDYITIHSPVPFLITSLA